MPDQKGAIPLLLLIAAIGIISVFGVVSFVPFKNQLLSTLFPKQSSHAAYLFADDFENGLQISTTDPVKWYRLWEEGAQGQPKTATVTLEPAAALHGSNGIHIKHVADVNNFVHDEARLDKTLNQVDELYARFRLKLISDFSGVTNRYIFGLADTATSYTSGLALKVNSLSATSKNRLGVYVNGGIKDTGVNLAANTPYCVEVYLKRDPVAGQVRVWLNGGEAPVYELSGTNTGSVPISWMRFGSDGGDSTITGGGVLADYYLDDLALNSTNRLGCGELPASFGPERSNGQPTAALPTGTSSVNLSVSTDVPATCKYSTTLGLDYDLIPNTFSQTGTTIHTQPITGITPNNNYSYFIRCKDSQSGTVNPDDYSISFRMGLNSIETKNTTLIPTYQSISVYAPYAQDENNNAIATLEWRKVGDQTWKKGMALTDDRRSTVTGGGNTFANPVSFIKRASVLGLQSNTDYEVRISYQDPDGIIGEASRTAVVRTKNDNFTLGGGKQFFIAANGTDINPSTNPEAGSINKPFRTLQFAVNLVNAGDSILVRGGTYSEAVYINTKSGTEDKRITVKNYNNEKVTFNGQNTLKNAFVVYKSNFIIISGFEIKDYSDTNLLAVQGGGGAIRVHSSKNIIIDNNTITGYIWSGIRTQNSSIITIQNNQITRTRDTDTTGNGHGISIWDNDTNVKNDGQFVIRNNIIRDLTNLPRRNQQYWDGIGGGSNFDIEGFVSKDSDIYGNFIDGCTDDSIEADGGLMNVRIWENTLVSNGHCFAGISDAPTIIGPLYVFRNLIYRHTGYSHKEGQASTGFKYNYNNTVVAGPKTPGATPVGNGPTSSNPGVSNFVSRNNIYEAGRYIIEWEHPTVAEAKTFDMDYDSLHTTDPARFIKWPGVTYSGTTQDAKFENFKAATKQEVHGLAADNRAEFIDFNSDNFKLKPDSRLKDKGQVILGFNDPDSSWPYQGSAPDIGAFEIGGSYGPKLASEIGSPPQPTPTPAQGKTGDINNSGTVDIFDYNALLTDFGKTQSGLAGDIDGNGRVNIFDYNLLLTNFGK